ncbi:MAG: PucR family transcriptional regulator [Brevibacterium aurantiacum]|uniref:PucR family transcriptional regulator n=1 Tax=Brevibacterium aurantiacum TaxID=273384 RepID=A0A3Q9P3C7_BREAU|nr:PucR family transcriptional regulator ligand-binding domain-containing protein [Brevibacterium aurantiacum]AZT98561.1 PucR family transcriptional regulator [Brevibacterium aurantiacum]MDN5606957.1 PucR family transcriptional regulator ligand-binding domain-containing protein [Brevibacterium sp.]MDN6377428.1 PucR family transcriptional regulator ligand-binding domain-containing protein [Brevibacterium aurantiacum]
MEAWSQPAPDLTFASLLDVEEIRLGEPELVSGGDQVGRVVRWVHIADSENVAQFLEGGELVLSTGMSYRSSLESTATFFDQLESASAAGAVIELIHDDGRPDEAAIENVRRAAQGRELPIVVLRRRIKFVRVTELAHQELLKRQLARVEHARTVHEVFTQLSLESAGAQDIVNRTAELLGTPVLLEDVGHRVLAQAGGTGREREQGQRWLQTPVGLRDRRWGRLLAPSRLRSDEEAAQVIERAAQTLTLARMAERDEQDLLVQAQGGLVREIIESTDLNEKQVRARAADLGFAPRGRMIPLVVRIDRGPSTDPTTLQLRERSLHRDFVSAASAHRCSTLSAGLQSGSFGVVLALPAGVDVDTTLQRLIAEIPADGTTVGVGRMSESLIDSAAGLESATQVAEIASTLELRERQYYRFSDVRLRGLLSSLHDDPSVRAFAEAELAPLLEAPSGRGDRPGNQSGSQPGGQSDGEEMLGLLEQFLAHGGNKSALARSGFLSRPALYARLDRLQRRLGVSLEDAESRTALHVAILWLRTNR